MKFLLLILVPMFAGVLKRDDAILGISLAGVDEREIGGENMPTPLSFSSAAGNVRHAGSPCTAGCPCAEDNGASPLREETPS